MNMLWNTQIVDTCIVFRSWHIDSTSSLLFACLIIVCLGIFFEYLRQVQRVVDQHLAVTLISGKGKVTRRDSNAGGTSGSSVPEPRDNEEVGLLTGRKSFKSPDCSMTVPPGYRVLRAALYGATVFLSFFLMLIFMTYNAYLILATVTGAAIGHYIFGATIDPDAILGDSKGMACH